MTAILGLDGLQIFFLGIKLVLAFYAIRNTLRRNDKKMALGLGIAWLGIIIMSFYTLMIPGVIIMVIGMVYVFKCASSMVNQPFREIRGRFRELSGAPDSSTFAESTQVKKLKKDLSQEETDKKYKKDRWK